MLPYVLGLTTLGSVRPYFRKHVLDTLDPTDFLLMNSIFISAFVFLYFVYTYCFNTHVLKKTYTNCTSLSYTQLGSLAILAAFTVAGSLMFFNLEKYYNTPFINHLLLKGLSTIALFVVGYFIFEEAYHSGHLLGIVLTFTGIMVLLFNPIKSV